MLPGAAERTPTPSSAAASSVTDGGLLGTVKSTGLVPAISSSPTVTVVVAWLSPQLASSE